jgi:hypothetical protein
VGQSGETAHRRNEPAGSETVGAAQNPFGFQQYRRANEYIAAFDQRLRLRRLLRVIGG